MGEQKKFFLPEQTLEDEKFGQLKELYKYLMVKSTNRFAFRDRIADMADRLRTIDNYHEYRLYHLLSGSSYQGATKFDLPGENSVERFLLDLKAEENE